METPTVSQALAGLTRREIGHRALEARDARDTYASLRERHGEVYAERAERLAAQAAEYLRIWRSLSRQDEVYRPEVAS